MPELAEVESYRRRWETARGARVLRVRLHPQARVFRETNVRRVRGLAGEMFLDSEARGKWILFRFTGERWLGVHLGMTGSLRFDLSDGKRRPNRRDRTGCAVEGGADRGDVPGTVATEIRVPAVDPEPVRHPPAADSRHDHLCLETEAGSLVFADPRLFGRVRADVGPEPPAWWLEIPHSIGSAAFTVDLLRAFLARRGRSPLKAVLLDQNCFPGIGNWMADEVLWRAGLHPRLPAGSLDRTASARLFRVLRFVAGEAMRIIGEERRPLPRGWLFHDRWEAGRRCPRTGVPLVRETVGGRTTCWSPGRQVLPGGRAGLRREA